MFDKMFTDFDYLAISGLNKELNYIYLYDYFNSCNNNLLVVCNTMYEATLLYQGLFNYTDKILLFPMDDFITSEAISISPEFKIERILTLNSLVDNKNKYIVVTCLLGWLRYLPCMSLWKKSILKISKNMNINREEFISFLYNLGYNASSLVSKTGEMAVRGYIIDVFPVGMDNPIRIEFWGNDIDSIRFFDIDSQLSTNIVDEITIYPFSEFILDKEIDDVKRLQKYLKQYSDSITNIGGYLGDYELVYYDYNQIMGGYSRLCEEVLEYRENNDLDYTGNYMNLLSDVDNVSSRYLLDFDNYLEKDGVKLHRYLSSSIINYKSNVSKFKEDINKYASSSKTVVVCFNNINTLNRIYDLFCDSRIIISNENDIVFGYVNFILKNINSGFIYNDYVVISENDIFDSVLNKSRFKNNFKLGTKIKSVSNIEVGDYIVHDIHGIGMYEGLVTLNKNGFKKDYIKLLFSGSDVLYVPVEKIDRISKYSSKEGVVPKLNKLGSGDFQRVKIRLKKKMQDIASKLLKIYASRESMEGYAFSSDDENQMLFESEFEFQETTDQIIASKKIKEEMEKNKPMDMLLCGDVGYGKTEVAFRAIFKAINDGKQVAYLCPTTILSNQQYKSALKRFRNFPVNIALLNRFVSVKEQKNIIQRLNDGKIDILFGTHRILSNDVVFKNLGLLVVDEEQRFGVTHKEKIKEYKANVDVLTLSATPIPRTLQMSMAGIRSLALIDTPPVNRFPVQTYVLPYNVSVIKDAIYKELARKGQVFILYNKVDSILTKVDEIKRLVPQVRIDYAHGRMNKETLENKMQDFIDYKSDVLVCTTIIETGIDIPNANTLIIIDADCFGLSQLYQIRGRIGRSDKIGYAYLMYNNRKELNDIAVKRLSTIKEFTELGSGFKIALRDLSIRGAGDILGDEQSGFIDSVGIDLYLKMLNDAVLELKGIPSSNDSSDDVDSKPLIEVATHISDDYTVDDDIKIEIHKLINKVDSFDKLKDVKSEIEDRFGRVSDDMVIYMYEEWFEKLALKLNIKDVKQTRNYVEITLPKDISSKIDGEELFVKAYEISRMFRFSYRFGRIVIIIDTVKLSSHYLVYVNELLSVLIDMINKNNEAS